MYKFTGFDVDHKHTTASIVQPGRPDRYATLKTHVGDLRDWLQTQRQPGDWMELTFEISGLAGHLYDGLIDVVDRLAVSNPAKLTWIYRPAEHKTQHHGHERQILLGHSKADVTQIYAERDMSRAATVAAKIG